MRLSETQVWAVVGMTSLVWLSLGVLGVTSGGGIGVVLSLREIIPWLLFVGFLYERWGWRWSMLHRLGLVKTPVVIGTWKGELSSGYDDGSGPKDSFDVYVAVSQSLTTVAVHLLSEESISVAIAGGIARTETGFPAIGYLYRNRPRVDLRQTRSAMHYGGAMVEIVGDPATGLNGEYWTDRKTIGRFTLREHSLVVAQTREHANALAYGPPLAAGVFDGLRALLRGR